MFRCLSEPLPLSEASLMALRSALNAPVLNVDFLPLGPARAAIVVFAEEWGGIGVALGLRSNGDGQVAVFRNQESIAPDTPTATVLDLALVEAERMGFLFDEDLVEAVPDGKGRAEAMALWGRLMGGPDITPAPRVGGGETAGSDAVCEFQEPRPLPPFAPVSIMECVRSERVEAESPGISLEGVPTSPPTASETPQPSLSKFRYAASAIGVGGETALSENQLGRIPLVRVCKGPDSSRRVSFLARLLSSF